MGIEFLKSSTGIFQLVATVFTACVGVLGFNTHRDSIWTNPMVVYQNPAQQPRSGDTATSFNPWRYFSYISCINSNHHIDEVIQLSNAKLQTELRKNLFTCPHPTLEQVLIYGCAISAILTAMSVLICIASEDQNVQPLYFIYAVLQFGLGGLLMLGAMLYLMSGWLWWLNCVHLSEKKFEVHLTIYGIKQVTTGQIASQAWLNIYEGYISPNYNTAKEQIEKLVKIEKDNCLLTLLIVEKIIIGIVGGISAIVHLSIGGLAILKHKKSKVGPALSFLVENHSQLVLNSPISRQNLHNDNPSIITLSEAASKSSVGSFVK